MRLHFHIAGLAALAALAALGAPATWSAESVPSAQQVFQADRARCLAGQSHQDQATCLKEAGAAYQESRRNGLGTAGDARKSDNATDRCRAQPEADRAACVERLSGSGTREGSVEGGGMIRRTETAVP